MRYLISFLGLCISFSACKSLSKDQESNLPDINEVALEVGNSGRYLSPEEVSDYIINEDPSIILVDVRSEEAFGHFSLPGAKNISWDQVLNDVAMEVLDCKRYNIILYSNDNLLAEKAWLLKRQSGCQTAYIMQGGLNAWANNILMPTPPNEMAPSEVNDLYQYRIAARNYFVGLSKAMDVVSYKEPVKESKKVTAPAKKKAEEKDDGC